MIDKSDAILSLRPGAEWVLRGDDLEWLDQNQSQPSESEIAVELVRLQSIADLKAYQRKRAAEYPAIGDQLDALFHAGVFPAEMANLIAAVKAKYPK